MKSPFVHRVGDYTILVHTSIEDGNSEFQIRYKITILDDADCNLPEHADIWCDIGRHWTDENVSFQQACNMVMETMSNEGTNNLSTLLGVIAAISRRFK
jgi:hypothetical protein